MKTGTDNRTKVIIAVALMVIGVALSARWVFTMFGSAGTSTAAAAPSIETPAPTRARVRTATPKAKSSTKKVDPVPRSLDPTLRFDWLRVSEDTKYQGGGRNIFLPQAVVIPQPVAPVVTQQAAAVPQGPPPPPPPPPINLKFFGFASKPGEPKSVFLSEGEDVFVAREGQIIDRRYRIVRISPMAVEVEDVLNNNRQSIPLTQG